MARILGIDYGEVRIGLALSDELGMFAHPLETIHLAKTEPLARIRQVVMERSVTTVVIGIPYRMDGTEGPAVRRARGFQRELQGVLGDAVIWAEMDERLSTRTAQERIGGTERDSKNVIDQAAATVILQDYLDSRTGPVLLPPDDDDE